MAALRVAIAAIDNAQAVAAPPDRLPRAATTSPVPMSPGPATAPDRPRRPGASCSPGELRAILRGQVAEYGREADRYQALDQPGAARRLRDQARLLAGYLPALRAAGPGSG